MRQRSSKAAESKRRALGNYFPGRICYMFLISKSRVTEIWFCAQLRDLRFENRNAMATSGNKTCFDAGKIGFCRWFPRFVWRPTLPFENFSSLHSMCTKFSDLKIWVQESTFATEKSSGRNQFCRWFRVFCLLSVKVCSRYKTHSKPRNLAGVWYVWILPVPGIQYRPVTVSSKAFSGHKTIMYTLKVGFLINLIRDRGSDCNWIINGRVELLVEYIFRRLLSKILFFIPVVTVRNVKKNNQSRLTSYWSNIETT